MHLTKSQKKYIKKNLRKLTVSEIAERIKVNEIDLQKQLEKDLGEEKLNKIIQKNPSFLNKVSRPLSFQWPGLKNFIKVNVPFLLLLALLVFGVYANCLKNEFLSDDIAGIMQEKHIGNPFYFLVHQPINFFRYFFYAIVYNIFGLNPFFFRLLNVFLHLGSVLTVFMLISLLYNLNLAIIVSSIFAVHPLFTESVTWISGGIHTQYAFFNLLALLLYLLAKQQNWRKKLYFASLISFGMALFTTEKSAILPLIIISYEFSFDKISKNIKRILPYFVLSGVAAMIVFAGGNFSSRVTALHSQYYQEKGFYNPFTQIPTAISSYLQLLFWPDKLTLYHSEMAFSNRQFFFMVIITALYFGLLITSFLKRNLRQYFFWLSFFLIPLLPMLTPFKVAWIVAERYAYLGSIGIIVTISLIFQKFSRTLKNKYLTYATLAVIITSLSVRTIYRNKDWQNQDTLWIAAARTSPSSPQNHNNLGDMYGRHGDLPKAAEEFQTAIKLKPDYGDAYHNLANIYRLMGKNDLAIENYQNAIRFNPNLWQSYQNISVILFENGKIEQATSYINKAIEVNPNNPDLYVISGYIFLNTGNKEAAKTEFLKALQIDPNNQNAINFIKNIQ